MTTLQEIGVAVFATLGCLFAMLSAVGICVMPDVYTRLHAASKAGTLGVICALLAAAIRFADLAVSVQALLVVGFLFATAPIAAQRIARAAYRRGVPLEEDTAIDELAGRYDEATDALTAPPRYAPEKPAP